MRSSGSDSGGGYALITGASSGIGAAFARRLAREGCRPVLVARRRQRLEKLSAELTDTYGVEAIVRVADLAKADELRELELESAELEPLDYLVNNAGFGLAGRFHEREIDREMDMINVHLTASTRLARAVLPAMVSRNAGFIINVSSVAGFLPSPGSVIYSATKSYLNTFSEALQMELGDTGVRVQALCPGFTVTEFHETEEYAAFKRSSVPRFLWMSSEAVVEASMHALSRGKVIVIPGLQYRILVMLLRNGLTRRVMVMLARARKKVMGTSAEPAGD